MKNLFVLFCMLSTTLALGQSTFISGNITDSNGEALIGATILEKGTTNGTVSDYNGHYELIVNKDATIIVSYTGYDDIEAVIESEGRQHFNLIENSQILEEVVVTGFSGVVGRARKRVASIQKIPESVTALNSEGIEEAGISNVADFAELVPNMKLSESQAVGVNFLVVRGIPQIRNADAPVAFVVDGVTIPDPALINQEVFDLALIEAVKGPQGALYGKNAIGGAINIYSKEPTNEMKNKIQLGVGNGGYYSGQMTSSGALSDDKAFYRLSGKYQNFNGLLSNTLLDELVDFSKDLNLRGQLIFTPTNKLKATVTLQYMDTDAGATYYSIDPASIGAFGETWVAGINANPTEGNNVIHQDVFGNSDMTNLFSSLNLQYNFGKFKLQSITSYSTVDRNTTGDLDFTDEPFDINNPFVDVFGLDQGEYNDTKSINQELRLSSNVSKSKLDWSIGGFVQNVERNFFQSDLTFSPDWAVTDYTVDFNTVALFGFLDYSITDKLSLSWGLRYDIDKFDQEDRLLVTLGFEETPFTNERSDNVLQPKVSLSYQASDHLLFYYNYGKGYRAGGYNPQTSPFFNQTFEKELTDNFEIGAKTSAWDNRFLLNGSVFYSNFNDRQQSIYDADLFVTGIYNYDKSTILGFELDSKIRLSKYLDLMVSYGFVDSKIDEGGTTGGENGTETDLNVFNGNFTSFIPQNNFNIGLASSIDLADNSSLDLNINVNGTGAIYWSDYNEDFEKSDGYQLLNTKATLNMNKLSISIWGKNILDQQYYLEANPGFGFAWRGRPATFGATVGYEF